VNFISNKRIDERIGSHRQSKGIESIGIGYRTKGSIGNINIHTDQHLSVLIGNISADGGLSLSENKKGKQDE
jgi:hypothetical protein